MQVEGKKYANERSQWTRVARTRLTTDLSRLVPRLLLGHFCWRIIFLLIYPAKMSLNLLGMVYCIFLRNMQTARSQFTSSGLSSRAEPKIELRKRLVLESASLCTCLPSCALLWSFSSHPLLNSIVSRSFCLFSTTNFVPKALDCLAFYFEMRDSHFDLSWGIFVPISSSFLFLSLRTHTQTDIKNVPSSVFHVTH